MLTLTGMNALGMRDESPRRIAAGLAGLLKSKQPLLVLDNCEHPPMAVVVLAGKLLGTAFEVRILAASREVPGVEGEYVLKVPPLSARLSLRIAVQPTTKCRNSTAWGNIDGREPPTRWQLAPRVRAVASVGKELRQRW